MTDLPTILASPEFFGVVAGLNLAVAVVKRALAKHRPAARDGENVKAFLFALPGLLGVVAVENVWGGEAWWPVRAQLYGIVWAAAVASYDGGSRFLALPGLPPFLRGALASYLAAPTAEVAAIDPTQTTEADALPEEE